MGDLNLEEATAEGKAQSQHNFKGNKGKHRAVGGYTLQLVFGGLHRKSQGVFRRPER
jgi:hypothetical protein